jgi:DNA mismatch endonuclease (patch repair protein)
MFRRAGIAGWRRHQSLPGRPDFTFKAERLVVFVDGCFWHGCPRCYKAPATNAAFWEEKLATNRRRDRRVSSALRARGWSVIRLWEHELGSLTALARVARKMKARQNPESYVKRE